MLDEVQGVRVERKDPADQDVCDHSQRPHVRRGWTITTLDDLGGDVVLLMGRRHNHGGNDQSC